MRTAISSKSPSAFSTCATASAYAIGAFKNLGAAEVEEVTLKFGLKIGGKTGIPFVTEGSAESNFEIEVKCKFPENKQNSST
ncbi:CU044_2847 family protein [Nostoc sp. NOS(2021)]|uniref:CU044_2847 family protein n=1 Tax=Nostoc sp. NOS(2021) TaxID=2815407 RepID=UPI0025F22ABC|nr:CU044_2847 family protein [Nostoc sp. NOS(2021)]